MREGPCSVDEQVYIPTRYSDSNRIVVAQAGGWQCHSGDSAAARPSPVTAPRGRPQLETCAHKPREYDKARGIHGPKPSFQSIFTYAAGTSPRLPSISPVHLVLQSQCGHLDRIRNTYQSSDVLSTMSTLTPSSSVRSPGSYARRQCRVIGGGWTLTSLVYSYIASAHSPSGSGSGTLGRGGGGGGEGVLGACDTVQFALFGGGGKFALRGKAEGVGGATCGGDTDLFAVELRKDENMAFPEERSTSPNFCAA